MLEISINMILDSLAEYGPERFFSEEEQLSFSGLRLYELGQETLSTSNIYMCTSRELTAEAAESGCCFLCIHKMAPALKKKLQGRRIVLLEDEGIGLAEVFNTVQSLFTDLREWHQHMHVSLIQSNDVQELLDLSESAIGNPIVLVDLSFKLLAYTKNIKTDDEVYNEVVSRGYHTKQTIERLTNTRQVDSIKRASVIDIAFPLPQMTQYQTMTKTFFIKGVPYAYLRMICSAHAPSKSLEERFALLAESVEYYLHNHYSAGSINKYMYEYVLVELIENKIKDEEDIEERIKCVGLQRDAEYQLLKIIFEDEDNTSLNYMLDQLLAIREQDEQKSTDYANLLYTYLINQCRPTDTAKLLHMHRNNVIYHVERLSEQLGVDLNDPETRLRLLLSYKVMDLL